MAGTAHLNPTIFDEPKFASSKTKPTAFDLEQLVDVMPRTETGVCEPGGVARISAVHLSRAGVESYDVTYVLDTRRERALAAILMTAHVTCEGRPLRRSSISAEAGNNVILSYLLAA